MVSVTSSIDWRGAFQAAFAGLDCHRDWPLKALTYFKIGGPADLYVQVSDLTTLQAIRQYCHQHEIKLTVLGGVSNVIVADEGIRGLVIQLKNNTCEITDQVVQAGAGLKTALLVHQTVAAGLTGLEYFLGVPGTVGGATLNNAHYLAHLIAEFITRVQVVTQTGDVIWLAKSECDFGYDHSRFQHSNEVIWQVEFQLQPGDQERSKALIREATEYRANTQPLGMPSSGCIFQNTPNTPALQARFPQFADKAFVPGGFLIDQAGLKGLRVGDVEVSHKHAAFMVNQGQGTAAQLAQLITQVKAAVHQQFGVELHEEVFYLQ
jgi:UDP-N-acetylmuramate dehydrogenase